MSKRKENDMDKGLLSTKLYEALKKGNKKEMEDIKLRIKKKHKRMGILK
jgi:hypothetical protein